ncbi:hypothetical protein INT43_006844 [Umbelopsis isabellina]|uniref:Uncharacterized protein n=1 Tax=Mortierella isabellina TaxID=91625 RepID=A0A8H7PWH8_MORIS|nr:hypothetical protein INT43_006844 [Umbelopsis isabellina]
MTMKQAVTTLLASLVFSAIIRPGHAIAIKNLVVFGDSYSDQGNLMRQTNGPVWVENVAYAWNASVYNFAFGGATCDSDLYALDRSDMSPSIRDQIEIYYDQKLNLKPEETVYAIWVGINDIALATADNGAKPVPPTQIVSCVRSQIAKLRHYFKASNIMLLEVPPLDRMPYFLNDDWTSELNIRLRIIRTYPLYQKVVSSPSTYGFSNVTHAYWEVCTGLCTDKEDDYLWWDGGHMTGAGHKLVANAVIASAPFEIAADEIYDTGDVKKALEAPGAIIKSDKYAAKAATGKLDDAPEKENESTADGGYERPAIESEKTWSRIYAVWVLLLLLITAFCCFSVGKGRIASFMNTVTNRYTSRGRFVPLRDLESTRE